MLAAPAIPPTRGFYDECMKGDGIQFSLGFMKPTPAWPFGSASSFGSPGAGGALGFADPAAGIGYAYVTSQMGTRLTGDPRDVALRDALYSAFRVVRRVGRTSGIGHPGVWAALEVNAQAVRPRGRTDCRSPHQQKPVP